MAISLNGIDLGTALQWTDEFSQGKVSQTVQRTLSGSVVVYNGQRKNGFPITLESGADYAWIKRAVLTQVRSLANQSGLVMPLVLRGETYSVMFDHTTGAALEAVPVFPYATPSDETYYKIKVKLITV